jgi:hypothetical protein
MHTYRNRIYHCRSIIVAGGLAAAAVECGVDLVAQLAPRLQAASDYYQPPMVCFFFCFVVLLLSQLVFVYFKFPLVFLNPFIVVMYADAN